MKFNFNSHVKGQTLIEVMLTLLIIGICVISLIRFQNYLSYDNSLMQQKSSAMILAMQKIETLRDYQVLKNTTGYTAYESITSGTSTSASQTTTYTLTWTVTNYTDPTYKIIDVTASWTDRYGSTQSTRLVTRVANVDPQNSAAIM